MTDDKEMLLTVKPVEAVKTLSLNTGAGMDQYKTSSLMAGNFGGGMRT